VSAAGLVEAGEERFGGGDDRGRTEIGGQGAVGGDYLRPVIVERSNEVADAVVVGVATPPRR
jgi:hypothetical protein